MLINKKFKYTFILLFSGFAFLVSVIIGLILGFYFSTIFFRAFLQGVVFFIIGFFILFMYEKYLKDLFDDVNSGDFVSEGKSEGCKVDTKGNNENEVNIPFNKKDIKSENNSINIDFLKGVNKHSILENELEDDLIKNKRKDKHIEYIKSNNPKIVADAIRAIMNKKE